MPQEGLVLPGKLLDLSLGGCCIETVQPLQPESRAEVLVQINDCSFRALSQIKAMRGRSAGMQFVQLTDSGNRLLREILTEVAKLHAAVSTLRGTRRRQDPELWRQIREDDLEEVDLRKQFPILGTMVVSQLAPMEAAAPADHEPSPVVSPGPGLCLVSIDLFI